MAKENLEERENKIIPALEELNAHWDSQTFLSSQSKRLKVGYNYKMNALWSHYKEKNGKILKKNKLLKKDKALSLSLNALNEGEE
jgi:predicted ATP-grasp superfamily ATP-dependent carboligase